MDCKDFLDRYSDYDDSLLGRNELAAFREHVARCASCERYDRILRKGRMLARQLPPPEPGADFVPRLQDRLARLREERRRRTATPVLGGAAAALAAVTVVASSMWALSILDQTPASAHLDPVVANPALTEPAVERTLPRSDRPRPTLPTLEPVPVREWTAYGVDHRVTVSYSPLIIGPPVYRTAGAFPGATTTSHTLD